MRAVQRVRDAFSSWTELIQNPKTNKFLDGWRKPHNEILSKPTFDHQEHDPILFASWNHDPPTHDRSPTLNFGDSQHSATPSEEWQSYDPATLTDVGWQAYDPKNLEDVFPNVVIAVDSQSQLS